jgi:hypothetical protein
MDLQAEEGSMGLLEEEALMALRGEEECLLA